MGTLDSIYESLDIENKLRKQFLHLRRKRHASYMMFNEEQVIFIVLKIMGIFIKKIQKNQYDIYVESLDFVEKNIKLNKIQKVIMKQIKNKIGDIKYA